MSEAGYVYLLMNVSMQGLVKIGRTQRDPEERARELSAATGVPTPFVLVFDAFFPDCVRAEEYVHAVLESKNYRVTSNREFFVAPVKEAIRAILGAEKQFGSGATQGGALASADAEPRSVEPWHVIFDLAKASHYGLEGTLQDDKQALSLYKQAAKLGSAEAYFRAGQMYLHNEKLRDLTQALIYLKEGARLGIGDCYAEMAWMFAADGHAANCKQCWSNYFAADTGRSDADRGRYGLLYMRHARGFRFLLDQPSIVEIKEAMLSELKMQLDRITQAAQSNTGSGMNLGPFYGRGSVLDLSTQAGKANAISLVRIEEGYVRHALYGDDGVESLHGEVRYLNPEGGGNVLLDEIVDRDNLVHFSSEDIRLDSFAESAKIKGQRVLCQVVEWLPFGSDSFRTSSGRLRPSDLIAFNVRAVPDPPTSEPLGGV